MKRIVLAYSGGLVTSAAVAWLAEQRDAEIVTVTLDFGQERELAVVRERALALGAVRAHVVDVREEFVRDFVLPALQADALEGAGHPLVVALARPLIARRLVEMAKMESAAAVAHGGAPGTAGESSLHQTIRSLDPSLEVIAPARVWGMSNDEVTAFARGHNIHVPPADSYRTDATLWGRILTSIDGDAIPEDAFTLTRPAADCEGDGAVVDIDFNAGVPVRANGVEMSLIEMIESLETIAGAHGVGRIAAGSYVVEAPAAVVLHAAHRELESLVVGADLARMKGELARRYAAAATDGRWFSDLREALAAFTKVLQRRVTGSVRVSLAGGRCAVTERTSVNEVRPSVSADATSPKAVA
ncbi:MAG: argininosuccinate synthase [Acidobacteriota bacterium]|nr:argininosuccinate synthase [Acidobacteriota bacterium]MDQ3417778.1 argininosuccinate synthase [Acidobacteriota bacterium]